MRSEAPVPTLGQVVAVVDAQRGSGLLRCLKLGCGGRLAWWGLGVPYTTVREWLRRFARRADRVHAWLCGLLPRLVDDPVWPPGTTGAAGDALAVLGALHQQMPGRWPVVAGLSPGQLAARLSRCGLLAPSWPPGAVNTSSPVT